MVIKGEAEQKLSLKQAFEGFDSVNQLLRVFSEAKRYGSAFPLLVFDKTWKTYQFSITTTAKKILDVSRPQAFFITTNDTSGNMLLGNRGVTSSSGFAIVQSNPMIIGLRENTELWALMSSGGPATLFVIEMGV